MTNTISDFQQLVALTQTMLEKAQSSEWDAVTELEAKRRESIFAFFQAPIQPESASNVAEGIQRILAMDHDIMALGIAEKQHAEQALRQIEQGRKAVKAYSL